MITLDRVLESDRLPSMPGVAMQVIKLTNSPDSDARELARIIKTDPALCAKILQTVNSSLFGLSNEISTIDRALSMLGNAQVASLVLSFSLMPESAQPGGIAKKLEKVWLRSVAQAAAASELAKRSGGGQPSEHFVSGLLQNVGELGLLQSFPDEYAEVIEAFESSAQPLPEIEKEKLGVTHVEVSVALCKNWKLPERIRLAIASHHEPIEKIEELAASGNTLHKTVAAASHISEYFFRADKSVAGERAKEFLDRLFGMSDEQINPFLEKVSEVVRSTAEIFSLDVNQCPSVEDILQAAQSARDSVYKNIEDKPKSRIELDRNIEQFWEANPKPIGLFVAEIDDLEELSKQFGSQFHERVRRHLSKAIRSEFKNGRLAVLDNNFVMVFPFSFADDLNALVNKVRLTFACEQVAGLDLDIEPTASFGYAQSSSTHSSLLSNGLSALQKAKKQGGNQVVRHENEFAEAGSRSY